MRDTQSELVVFIVGPTAVGKSQVALQVADKVHGAIITADSMQVYRDMDIGTAKPGDEERAAVPHYLLDIKDPADSFSVAEFKELAMEAIDQASYDGVLPLVVGGSGLYVKALVSGYEFPDPGGGQLRRKLYQMASRQGSGMLHEQLKQVDPAASDRIHPNDTRRIVRALEVWMDANEPISSLQDAHEDDGYRRLMFGLTMERGLLHERIEKRVEDMLASGLRDEVRELAARGLTVDHVSMQAVGYKELLEAINGNIDETEAIRLIKRNTRRLARRQYTWFRRFEDVEWLDVGTGNYDEAAETICRKISLALEHDE